MQRVLFMGEKMLPNVPLFVVRSELEDAIRAAK